jgi:ASC-1-like (ASCH) protein
VPLFFTKKEVFQWLSEGKKTIDLRKGKPCQGDTAVFQSGANLLRWKILERKSGKLTEIMGEENYKQVIPPARNLGEALDYLHKLYEGYEGLFTAYYLEVPKKQVTYSVNKVM